MKTFVIINGKVLRTITAVDLDEARNRAINTCDHSKEVFVHEVKKNINMETRHNLTAREKKTFDAMVQSLLMRGRDLLFAIKLTENAFKRKAKISLGILNGNMPD